MKIFKNQGYLYMNTEDNISYHLGEDGKIYVHEAKGEADNKRVIISSVVAVAIIVLLALLTRLLPVELLKNNSAAAVLGLTLLGLIVGVVCVWLIKDEDAKTFSEDKTIEMDEEKIKEHLEKGHKKRLVLRLFIYGWLLLSLCLSVLMASGYMLKMVCVIPWMWAAGVLLLATSKFFASEKKAKKIIEECRLK